MAPVTDRNAPTLRMGLIWFDDNAEASNRKPRKMGLTSIPDCSTTGFAVTVPALPSQDTMSPCCWASGVDVASALIRTVPIRAPFPHVPEHVKKPEGISLLLPHRVRLGLARAAIPSVFGKPAAVVTNVIHEGRLASCAACVFPLGLSRQPHGSAGLLGQSVAERLRVGPGHAVNGVLRPIVATGVIAHHCLILLLRHFVDAHEERPLDDDRMLRGFITVIARLCRIGSVLFLDYPYELCLLRLRATHEKLTGGDLHQRHSDPIAKVQSELSGVAGGLLTGCPFLAGRLTWRARIIAPNQGVKYQHAQDATSQERATRCCGAFHANLPTEPASLHPMIERNKSCTATTSRRRYCHLSLCSSQHTGRSFWSFRRLRTLGSSPRRMASTMSGARLVRRSTRPT